VVLTGWLAVVMLAFVVVSGFSAMMTVVVMAFVGRLGLGGRRIGASRSPAEDRSRNDSGGEKDFTHERLPISLTATASGRIANCPGLIQNGHKVPRGESA
jgi:hypothetical protein